jgi:hypothetical protein
MMALGHGLAPFVCGRSVKKRRVDQHKRMQLILEPRWLVPPSSAHCNRPCDAQSELVLSPFSQRLSGSTAREIEDTAGQLVDSHEYLVSLLLVEDRNPNHPTREGRIYRRAVCGARLALPKHCVQWTSQKPEGHGCCVRCVTRVSVDGKSASLCVVIRGARRCTHDPGSCICVGTESARDSEQNESLLVSLLPFQHSTTC